MSGDADSLWRTYVVDSDGRRLTPALVGPAADFTHPDSPGSLALMALPTQGGFELEHAPTGVRIIIPSGSAEPLEDLHRLSQMPGVLRAAADVLDPPRRGPRRGPKGGWADMRFRIAIMWLEKGQPPRQADLADDLAATEDREAEGNPSSISRAVRGSGYSIRRSAGHKQGAGWDNQLVLAAMFLRRLQAEIPAPAPDEPAVITRKRELLNSVDLTGF